MQLEPCPSCFRHVRTDETVCPFCAASIASAMMAAPRRTMPDRRLGRAALVSFGLTVAAAGSATTLEACTTDVPLYGAPVQPGDDEDDDKDEDAGKRQTDAGTVQTKDAGRPNATPAYGAPVQPIPRDAGALDAGRVDAGASDAGRSDAGDAGDAGKADAETRDAGPVPVVPPYGAPTPT